MANFRASYAEIEQVSVQLSQGREEITARLQSLQQHIHGLVASGFVTDQASVKFNSAYEGFTVSATNVIARLDDIQAFLTQASHAIREMDAQIAARIH